MQSCQQLWTDPISHTHTQAHTSLPVQHAPVTLQVHMIHIPGTNRYFFMERPSGKHPDKSAVIAGFWDQDTRTFVNVPATDSLFCAGHTLTADGNIVVVGGHIAKSGYAVSCWLFQFEATEVACFLLAMAMRGSVTFAWTSCCSMGWFAWTSMQLPGKMHTRWK